MKKLIISLSFLFIFFSSDVFAQTENSWSMAGANPQRTSWTPEEVRGQLRPIWYKPIEPYIPWKVQIIAANDTLYISTAKGLYAIDSETGAEKWVYPTELPLGHSPTYHETTLFGANHPKRIYVGGFDHKIHAIDADTGEGIWTFEAEKGFQTNPLVVEILNPHDNNAHLYIYAGNRDSYEYAIEDTGTSASLLWKYQTGGPVLFSTAISRDNQTIYFASNDSHAYALKAIPDDPNNQAGQLAWKSQKLPGEGFHSWWPVIYRDQVIFAGSNNYRNVDAEFGGNDIQQRDIEGVYYGLCLQADQWACSTDDGRLTPLGPLGQEPGNWVSGTLTLDATRISEYYDSELGRPHRRTVFFLDQSTGNEYTYNYTRRDGTAGTSYAPFLWFGTHSGTRYPPVIGRDDVVYLTNNFIAHRWIPRGHIAGWKIGTPVISIPSSVLLATDEPMAYSVGGNLIYWNHVADTGAGSFDISIPQRSLGVRDSTRESVYFLYSIQSIFQDYEYRVMYTDGDGFFLGWTGTYRGPNGAYGYPLGDQNPPIPYKGKVYIQMSNSIVAWKSDYFGSASGLPLAQEVQVQDTMSVPSKEKLKQDLENEVLRMIEPCRQNKDWSNCHLRPGWVSTGLFDYPAMARCSDRLIEYFHNTSDTLIALTRALPYLSPSLQSDVRAYLKSEFESYPPYRYIYNGFTNGAAREIADIPPDQYQSLINNPNPSYNSVPSIWANPRDHSKGFEGWGVRDSVNSNYPPYMFYAMWKYALITDNPQQTAQGILANSTNPDGSSKLEPIPSDAILSKYPFAHNAFVSGYLGYLELQKLAGYPETASIRSDYERILALRATSFSKDTPYTTDPEVLLCGPLNVARNFMFLVPELADYLQANALVKMQEALQEYEQSTPYWFVSKYEDTLGENGIQQLHDYDALFQAKALILKEPQEELVKYLDVPAFERGGLFYIQNLVSAIEAPASNAATPSPIPPTPPPVHCTPLGDIDCSGQVGILDLSTLLSSFGKKTGDAGFNLKTDLDNSGEITILDLSTLLSNFGRARP